MATEPISVKWDDIEEPNPESYVRKAGVYQGCEIEDIAFVPPAEKDGKKTGNYVTVKFTIPTETGISKFTDYLFEPQPPEKIEYFDKLYVNGVAVRDLTPEEQHEKGWNELMLYLLQLGMAVGVPFTTMKAKLTEWGKNLFELATGFSGMLQKNSKADFPHGKLVFDIKILWINSEKKQTSRLNIPKPRGRSSITFWPTPIIKEGTTTKHGTSVIVLSAYEQEKCMSAKFSNNSNKPKDDKPVTENGALADTGANAGGDSPVPEGDLF